MFTWYARRGGDSNMSSERDRRSRRPRSNINIVPRVLYGAGEQPKMVDDIESRRTTSYRSSKKAQPNSPRPSRVISTPHRDVALPLPPDDHEDWPEIHTELSHISPQPSLPPIPTPPMRKQPAIEPISSRPMPSS